MDRDRLSQLDREMNRALKNAKTPQEVMAVKKEFTDKKKRVMVGVIDAVDGDSVDFPIQPVKETVYVGNGNGTWTPAQIKSNGTYRTVVIKASASPISPSVPSAPQPPPVVSNKEKRKQLKKLEKKEKSIQTAESLHWQKRYEELGQMKVDRSRPFIGAGDIHFMLKPKR